MTVRGESDATASEHEFSEFLELFVSVQEFLDSITVVAMCHHKVLLEIHEFIDVRQLVRHLFEELLHLHFHFNLFLVEVVIICNPQLLPLINDVWSQFEVELEQIVNQLDFLLFFIVKTEVLVFSLRGFGLGRQFTV